MESVFDRGLTRRGWLVAGGAAAVMAAGSVAGCDRRGRAPAAEPQAPLSADESRMIVQALAAAPSHGFLPTAFPTAGLKPGDAEAQPRIISEIVAYAAAQHGLGLPKSAMDPNWDMRARHYDAGADFKAALTQNHVQTWLATLPPPDPRYEALRKGYLVYLKVASAGGWPAVPDGPTLKTRSGGPRVAALRARLAFEDPAVGAAQPADRYDRSLAQAVADFQARHGLHPTGEVDKATLQALNVPAIARAAQIRANLERWRWAPRELPATRIEVNSAGQLLDLYWEGQPAMHMLVAAGKPGDETPILASKVQTVVLNPTWTVPKDIAQNELIPKGDDYLSAHHFTQDNGQLVQQPGPDNALGQVKFLFPNNYAVYLHDTPAKSAFDKAQRSVSHGCVRLEKAVDLAKFLLGKVQGWAPDKVDAALQDDQTQNVDLKQPVPVEIFYWTAWAEGDRVAFRDDIYGWDQATLRALDSSRGTET